MRDYAKELGERLERRVVSTIFPQLARGFLEDRQTRLGRKGGPSDEELSEVCEATLTLLFRLLFLLYAEARHLLPICESAYRERSLRRITEEIAAAAGMAESEIEEWLKKAYSATDTTLYDRLARLFAAIDRGDAALNVPTYNGWLFRGHAAQSVFPLAGADVPYQSEPVAPPTESREERIARFLADHKVPDRALALAIDHLARDPDDKTCRLGFIDYKSLEVRHLGAIYERLLEFQLKLADEDLTTQTDKKGERYLPLSRAKPRRGRAAEVVVAKGEVYLFNDNRERKASGSYYTPDAIVKYIVEQAVGPVLAQKLESLRGEFCAVRSVYDREVEKATALGLKKTDGSAGDPHELAAETTYAEYCGLVERLFEFRVLDPAMGSGHFLVEAADFITDRLFTFLNQFPINPVTFMLARTRRSITEALAASGVSVDRDKLSDVNLLKRLVLKRCIYGVDLDPMAVELAKVSLWLDAFTLGAPLPFLDHHLRCGNSLIGATFKELASATKGQRARTDYEPLMRAIVHLRQVTEMADATVAEVKRSASEHNRAREELSGYQIVLDLLVASHFGHPQAPGLLQHGDSFDLTSRARFKQSLRDREELSRVERVEPLARQPDRCFFHWEMEFPEVFFAFCDAGGRQLKHKNEIAKGSAGFDAVVGNPPYSGHKGDFDAKPLTMFYEVCAKNPNLATAFLERGCDLLARHGRLGMIVPKSIQYVDSWDAARNLLSMRHRLIGIADVSQAFDGVLLEQTVCIVEKATRVNGYWAATLTSDGVFSGRHIDGEVADFLRCLPAEVDERSLKLFARIHKLGPVLKDIAYTSQALGYQAHVNEDVSGVRIPIYRGKQIRPLRIDAASDFIDRSFLQTAGADELTAKVRAMLQPKVVSQNIVAHVTQPKPRVWIISAADHEGIVCLNTISTTVVRDPRFPIDYLAAVLNSTLASWFYTEFVFCRAIRTMHFDNYYAGKLPIAAIDESQKPVFGQLARNLSDRTSRGRRQRAIDDAVFAAYRLTSAEASFLYEYCYGTTEIEAVLTGF